MYQPEDDNDNMLPPLGPGDSPPLTEWFSESVRVSESKYHVEAYPNASQVYGRGGTLLDVFDADIHAEKRKDNTYYPFASREEWEIASFLLLSSLSVSAINKFLSLELVSHFLYEVVGKLINWMQIQQLDLSFHTANELCGRAEMLQAGPQWKCTPWTTIYLTKVPLKLFHRDSLD